MKFIDIT